MRLSFKKAMKYRPSVWPKTEQNYFDLKEVVYLKKLVGFMKEKGFSAQEILDGWAQMLSYKVTKPKIVMNFKMSLGEIFYLFFRHQSYYYTKQHYAALLSCLK